MYCRYISHILPDGDHQGAGLCGGPGEHHIIFPTDHHFPLCSWVGVSVPARVACAAPRYPRPQSQPPQGRTLRTLEQQDQVS